MIRLINYGYKKWKVGDIVDLGEKKNKSMISIGRAVADDRTTSIKSSTIDPEISLDSSTKEQDSTTSSSKKTKPPYKSKKKNGNNNNNRSYK